VSDYERRKEAVEKLARDMVKHSGGKISSDQAARDAAKVARETDSKKGNK
jgi:Arc/MetJ family transcription regulator